MADDEINWDAHARMDPILHAMQKHGVPLTRDNYIDLKYGSEDMPAEWTEEHEDALPSPFRRHP